MQIICFIITKYYLYKYNYLHWNIKFNNAKWTAGETNYNDKVLIFSNFYLKKCNMLLGILELRTLILHEIAHIISGNENGHNIHWKTTCKKIGGNGKILTYLKYDKYDFNWRMECSNKNCSQNPLFYYRRSIIHCPTCGSYLNIFDNHIGLYFNYKKHNMITRYQ